MKAYTCCFTGHREIPPEKYMYIRRRLNEVIAELVKSGINRFCTGGALGFDTLAAFAVLEAKKMYPHIALTLILPWQTQSSGWASLNKANYDEILAGADEVKYISEGYTPYCLMQRNRALVDESSVCVCFLEKNTGGTAYTVNYAKKICLK